MNVAATNRVSGQEAITDIAGEVMEAAPARTRIQATRGWSFLTLRDVWAYRELLYFLVWRDLKLQYKQTALGITWVVLQPVLATVILTLIFGLLARLPSGDLPYPLFVFMGMLPWTYLANVLNRAGTSLVTNAQLVTKVYFPRILMPLACVIHGLVDVAVFLVLLIFMMAYFSVTPSITSLGIFVLLLILVAASLGLSLWLAALNVRYRDVKYVLPFLLQVWMYLTPIVYPSTLIPARWRALYALNPMAGIVEGFRWALTGRGEMPTQMLLVSTIAAIAALVTGVVFFRSTERTFADVI